MQIVLIEIVACSLGQSKVSNLLSMAAICSYWDCIKSGGATLAIVFNIYYAKNICIGISLW